MADRVRGAALPLSPRERAKLRRRLDNDYLSAAGLDPAALTTRQRTRHLEALAAARAKAKRDRQAHVKRLHHARLRCAMPPWADTEAIQAVYAEARRLTAATGIPHEVDHIHPLLGKDASGLHWHENLRVVTRTENRRKGNRPPSPPRPFPR